MKQDKVLQVCYEDQTVGTLAMTADHKVAFQYSDEWLETGFSINPFSLPLQKQVFVPVKDHFDQQSLLHYLKQDNHIQNVV